MKDDAGRLLRLPTAFVGTNEKAAVAGDVAMLANEVQPVLKALRKNGIDVVAIHQHMTGEQPRLLFLHYWGRGAAAQLAKTVKTALDLTGIADPQKFKPGVNMPAHLLIEDDLKALVAYLETLK